MDPFELPPELSLPLLLLLCIGAFAAGALDAIVGGGGLIQIPVLFAALPGVPAATLLGSNKLSGIWGTSAAAWRYGRSVQIAWPVVLPGALAAFLCAFLGAVALTHLPSDLFRKLLPCVLLGVAIYTFRKKDFGAHHAPHRTGWAATVPAMLFGGAIGFYDGFFGPGTGSFLVFVFVRYFGFDFLRASAAAKVVNVACNLSALIWFGATGHLLVALGLSMAVFNVAGSLLGSRLAIRHGSQFVRKLFLIVVGLLVLRTGYDAWLR